MHPRTGGRVATGRFTTTVMPDATTTTPFCVLVTFTARDGREDDLAAALAEVDAVISSAPGCLLHAVQQSTEDAHVFWIAERFEDRSAHAAAISDARVQAASERIGTMLSEPAIRIEGRPLPPREP